MAIDQTALISSARDQRTILFSADSHVVENPKLWQDMLPSAYFGSRPEAQEDMSTRPDIGDPASRIEDMTQDGVEGEVLYPTLALKLFSLDDADLQERAFRAYNSRLIEFCSADPLKLVGLGLIPVYEIAAAIKELEYCVNNGMRGCEIWQSPHPSIPFTSRHYEPFWEAAAALNMPVSLHIATGFNYASASNIVNPKLDEDDLSRSIARHKGSVILKLQVAAESLMEIMYSGVLDRHPDLKIVIVENEIAWIPFVLDQLDYYVDKYQKQWPVSISRRPSEYFGSQVLATFFRDPVGMKMLGWWGVDACMWSNDYPHPNSSWPHSQQLVGESLGYLDQESFERLCRGNVLKLYGLDDGR